MCYSGTDITNGMGIIKITSVGNKIELGLIGESLNLVRQEKTPLEKQINKLVFVCTIISGFIFLLTLLITYINYSELAFCERIVESILASIPIAMATIPEEIPSSLSNLKLSFEGLIALYDPPRYGVKTSLEKCYTAGIRVIMITRDNGETAKGIAKK